MNSEQKGGCLFCRMLEESEDARNRILARGETCFVVINAYPYTSGHVMVVCNRHTDRFSELTPDESKEIMRLIQRLERAILDVYQPGGINVGVNLGRSAGAGVLGHLHVHLVPRWQGDTNFMTAVGDTRVVSEDLDDTFRRLRSYLEEEG